MTEIQQTDPFEQTDRPGKTRTEWHPRIIDKLARKGHRALAHYHYMVQQVRQFRDEEDFAMQQALSETLEQFDEELVTRMLEELPAERRLRGLPLEERLAGLSDEDVARLRELLDRKKRP
jgi:hypothetical protein